MICVTQELEDFTFIFPPKQNCSFQDILIFSEELASQNPKCQASHHVPQVLIPQVTVLTGRRHSMAKTVACFQNLSYHHALGRRGSSPNLQCLEPLGMSILQQPAWLLLMGMPQDSTERLLHAPYKDERELAQQTLKHMGCGQGGQSLLSSRACPASVLWSHSQHF